MGVSTTVDTRPGQGPRGQRPEGGGSVQTRDPGAWSTQLCRPGIAS